MRAQMEIQNAKSVLRWKIRARLEKMSSDERAAFSTEISARLKEQPFWKSAASVLFFSPLPDEANLWPLLVESLAAGKICGLPQFDAAAQDYVARRVQDPQNDIVTGQFWIPEPRPDCAEIPADTFELVLVPGVAFDLKGRRLGRGRGFFDRLLVEVRGLKCGIAFELQMANEIPTEAHDIRMDFILTPTRCVEIEK